MNSIQGRLNAIAFLFIIGTSVAVGVVGFRLTADFEKGRFRDHFSLLASYLARNAELGLLLENKQILESLAENMLEVDDVQRVEIHGQDGKVLVNISRENMLGDLGIVSSDVVSENLGQSDAPFLTPVDAEEILGRITLSFSYAGLEQLKKQLAFQFFILALALTVVAVVLYWMLSRAITAPLHGLLKIAGQVSQGQMSVRAKGGSLLEIDTLATAFNDMLDTLEMQRQKIRDANKVMAKQQVLAEMGKLSMIVAHEIKNPLAIIKGSLDVLKKDNGVEVQVKEKLMVFVDEEVGRINKLVEDFLLFSRPRTPDLRDVSVHGLIASLSQRLDLIQDGCIAWEIGSIDHDKMLHCDTQLIERALSNIVRNAIEVSAENSAVKVLAACSSRRFVFIVRDNGPGVPAEDRDRIFEPFYSTKTKGTGLGLAIVKEIITAHDGKISVINPKSGGASFNISLPLVVR